MEKIKQTYPRVLTIAGSDSGGGAGIQADIKAISATGSYAASAITAVTVQNTLGVESVFPVPADVVAAQARCVLSDIGADAVKIGMLFNAEIIRAVATVLDEFKIKNLVLDPVMVSTSGHKLLEDEAVAVLTELLVPRARVITPNIPEAEILVGEKIRSQDQLPAIAKKLSLIGSGGSSVGGAVSGNFGNTLNGSVGGSLGGAVSGRVSVLMKAGHLSEDYLTDIFYNAEEDHFIQLRSKRFHTPNTHGTGCTLSSAFASFLAQGYSLDDAARAAKEYIAGAIESGSSYSIGHGHGPVNHFFKKIFCD